MSIYIKTVKCGDKSYYLSISGEDVYFSSTSKTGGTRLKGIKNYNNILKSTKTNKKVDSDFIICEAISESLKF